MKFSVDTVKETIFLDGEEYSLAFLKGFLEQPEGSVVIWRGKTPDGKRIFTFISGQTLVDQLTRK